MCFLGRDDRKLIKIYIYIYIYIYIIVFVDLNVILFFIIYFKKKWIHKISVDNNYGGGGAL